MEGGGLDVVEYFTRSTVVNIMVIHWTIGLESKSRKERLPHSFTVLIST